MKVIVFGATGMVGQGVLRECLLNSDVTQVLSVARSSTGQKYDKLRELLHKDFTDFSALERELTGYDACFFCLGVSSAGMNETDYARVTYDFTLAAAKALAKVNPRMTFIYVSGAGTDSSEKGRSMWARVKAEPRTRCSPCRSRRRSCFAWASFSPCTASFRKRSCTAWSTHQRSALPCPERRLPQGVTTSERVGRAMLAVAKRGFGKTLLENADINALAAGSA